MIHWITIAAYAAFDEEDIQLNLPDSILILILYVIMEAVEVIFVFKYFPSAISISFSGVSALLGLMFVIGCAIDLCCVGRACAMLSKKEKVGSDIKDSYLYNKTRNGDIIV